MHAKETNTKNYQCIFQKEKKKELSMHAKETNMS